MEKTKIVIANWKMCPVSIEGAKELFSAVQRTCSPKISAEVVVAPPFVYLTELVRLARSFGRGKNLRLGAQDCFWEQAGAYTGEVSPEILKTLGATHVLIGHSERRRYLKETDEMAQKKLAAALRIGIIPILCVGEDKSVRRKGLASAKQFVKKQLLTALRSVSQSGTRHELLVAYEPVWAISSVSGGKSDTPEEAVAMILWIKQLLGAHPFRLATRVLYGGSVNMKNAAGFMELEAIDGALVGDASLRAQEFCVIVKIASSFS